MSVSMSRPKAVLFAITVFLTTFVLMWQMYIFIITHDLFIAFPNNGGAVTALLGWPPVFTAVVSLLAGWLMRKISSKTELIFGLALFGVFGVTAPIGSNATWLLICCFGMAVACGFINTAGTAIVAQVFIDETKRARMLGFYNGILSGMGALVSMVGGFLALHSWQAGFSMFWAAVPALVLCVFFLPNIKPDSGEAGKAAVKEGPKEKLGARFWWFFTSQFLYNIAYTFFMTFISLYVAENELGSTVFTGTLTSLASVTAFIAGATFGFFFDKLRRKANYIYYILPIFCFVWAWLAPSVLAATIGITVYGFCYGGAFSLLYAYASSCVPISKVGFVMGLVTFCANVAIWLGVYVVTWLMGMNGGKITPTYPVAAGILVVALIIELVWFRKDDKEGFLKVPTKAA